MVPLMWTSTLDRAISYVRYLLHNNSQTNARHNIASHYDKVQFSSSCFDKHGSQDILLHDLALANLPVIDL